MRRPRSIRSLSAELLDVELGPNGSSVVVLARPASRRGIRARLAGEVVVVVDPHAARVLGRRLIAAADEALGPPA